ncbi:MAG TPA: alpha-galactosidase, partial [Cryomorphaceae bacterium]|nr:alpha-galactosidase [Cryomorphaceae bacterium]
MRVLAIGLLIFNFGFCNLLAGEAESVFTFKNSEIRKEFIAGKDQPGAIRVVVESRENFGKLNNSKSPYFRFSLNNQIVTSTNAIWQFKELEERAMLNDGTEYTLHFEATQGELKGLQLAIYQQFFPDSSLVREKLLVSAKGEQSFSFTKFEEENLFEFPCYKLKTVSNAEIRNNEIRIASWNEKPVTFGERPKGNHMFYPKIIERTVTKSGILNKGPINLSSNGKITWFTTYEHASQDNDDPESWHLGIENGKTDTGLEVNVRAMRGAYYEGEILSGDEPYASVWTATAFYDGDSLEKGKAILRRYLLDQICEYTNTREPSFYYNTWGLQRNVGGKGVRKVLTYDRIFEEIEYAAQLGIDIFVLDDGWQQTFGVWTPHDKRLSEGLAPIKKKLDEHNIKMGLWFSPMGIDSSSQRYKDHPEWIVKDSEGNPVKAQWRFPAFDFVSGFSDLFVEDCKKLIDKGCLFMKWDAISANDSSLPNLDHGGSDVSEEERRARGEYLLPIYVTRAMEELMAYEPKLVIEIDLTEKRRKMIGLAALSQGKFFFMNNGASGYNDYSTYRAKSMRTIVNEFAGIIPLELFTYANYPQNKEGAMIYNTHNSVLAGHGFWGNLALMKKHERQQVGELVSRAKAILPDLIEVNPEVIGKVGDSPEI